MPEPTPRERFIRALELGEPHTGLCPAIELGFQLWEEKFGRSPHAPAEYQEADRSQRSRLRREDAELLCACNEAYDLASCELMYAHTAPGEDYYDALQELIGHLRDLSGDRYITLAHGDATMALPDGNAMWELTARMADDRAGLLRELDGHVDHMLEQAPQLLAAGVEGFALCADYCYNSGPWCSPAMFADFVTPFLTRLTKGLRDLGAYVIKHTDGNIMPILDQLVASQPHALHSLDPQAGVDMAEVKRLVGNQVCLVGNVNCGLLQTGTDEEVRESARYALVHGMPGGGFAFALSNVVFKGMPLERYELVQRVRHEIGVYP